MELACLLNITSCALFSNPSRTSLPRCVIERKVVNEGERERERERKGHELLDTIPRFRSLSFKWWSSTKSTFTPCFHFLLLSLFLKFVPLFLSSQQIGEWNVSLLFLHSIISRNSHNLTGKSCVWWIDTRVYSRLFSSLVTQPERVFANYFLPFHSPHVSLFSPHFSLSLSLSLPLYYRRE